MRVRSQQREQRGHDFRVLAGLDVGREAGAEGGERGGGRPGHVGVVVGEVAHGGGHEAGHMLLERLIRGCDERREPTQRRVALLPLRGGDARGEDRERGRDGAVPADGE